MRIRVRARVRVRARARVGVRVRVRVKVLLPHEGGDALVEDRPHDALQLLAQRPPRGQLPRVEVLARHGVGGGAVLRSAAGSQLVVVNEDLVAHHAIDRVRVRVEDRSVAAVDQGQDGVHLLPCDQRGEHVKARATAHPEMRHVASRHSELASSDQHAGVGRPLAVVGYLWEVVRTQLAGNLGGAGGGTENGRAGSYSGLRRQHHSPPRCVLTL